jgi:hypothetical protein
LLSTPAQQACTANLLHTTSVSFSVFGMEHEKRGSPIACFPSQRRAIYGSGDLDTVEYMFTVADPRIPYTFIRQLSLWGAYIDSWGAQNYRGRCLHDSPDLCKGHRKLMPSRRVHFRTEQYSCAAQASCYCLTNSGSNPLVFMSWPYTNA